MSDGYLFQPKNSNGWDAKPLKAAWNREQLTVHTFGCNEFASCILRDMDQPILDKQHEERLEVEFTGKCLDKS